MSDMEQTQVMGAAGATMQMPAGSMDAFRTQMGGTMTCPICQSSALLVEPYCGECGFLLTSAPPADVAVPVAEAPAAELVAIADGQRYRLRPGINTIGRVGTDILVAESTVSRNHARVTVENGTVTIEDLGSSNGSKVGGQRLSPNQPVTAPSGTAMRFGSWRVVLEIAGSAVGSAYEPTVMVTAGEKTQMEGSVVGESTQMGDAFAAEIPNAEMPVASAEENQDEEPPVARLERTAGPASDLTIRAGRITIGRKATNNVVMSDDIFISGQHADIVTDNTGSYLTDLGSTNGTVVNGQKMTAHDKQLLLEGDEVQIGQSRFIFRLALDEEDELKRMDYEGDLQPDPPLNKDASV